MLRIEHPDLDAVSTAYSDKQHAVERFVRKSLFQGRSANPKRKKLIVRLLVKTYCFARDGDNTFRQDMHDGNLDDRGTLAGVMSFKGNAERHGHMSPKLHHDCTDVRIMETSQGYP